MTPGAFCPLVISVAKALGPALQPEAYFGTQPTAGRSAHLRPGLWPQHTSLMFLFPLIWTLDLKKKKDNSQMKGH